MIKLGIIIDIDSPLTFTFKVFDDVDHEVSIGMFVIVEENDSIILARITRMFRRNLLLQDRILSSIEPESIEKLKSYGIDVQYVASNTYCKCVIVGVWNGKKVDVCRRPPKLFSYVSKPSSKLLEEILKPSSSDVLLDIGHLRGYPSIRARIDGNKLVTHHCAILASTGSGKSWLAGVIIEELFTKAKIPIIVFDPHSEYSSMQIPAYRIGIELSSSERILADEISSNVHVYVPGKVDTSAIDEYFEERFYVKRKYVRFGIKPHKLPFNILLKLLDHYYGISETQKRILEEAWFSIRREDIVSIQDLLKQVEEYGKEAAPRGYAGEIALSTLISKLRQLFESRPFFITKFAEHYGSDLIRELDFEEIVNTPGIHVFDLSGLDLIDQQAIITLVLDSIMKLATKRKSMPTFIVIEEAHNFAPSKGDAISLNSILRIAREGRKFGVGLCIISQRPARIHPDVLSQCMTQIFKRMISPIDIKYVRDVTEFTTIEDLWEVRLLNEEDALIVGISTPIPLPIKVRKRYTAHGGITPTIKTRVKLSLKPT